MQYLITNNFNGANMNHYFDDNTGVLTQDLTLLSNKEFMLLYEKIIIDNTLTINNSVIPYWSDEKDKMQKEFKRRLDMEIK